MQFRAHRRRVRYVSPLTVAAILAREDREARERAAAAPRAWYVEMQRPHAWILHSVEADEADANDEVARMALREPSLKFRVVQHHHFTTARTSPTLNLELETLNQPPHP